MQGFSNASFDTLLIKHTFYLFDVRRPLADHFWHQSTHHVPVAARNYFCCLFALGSPEPARNHFLPVCCSQGARWELLVSPFVGMLLSHRFFRAPLCKIEPNEKEMKGNEKKPKGNTKWKQKEEKWKEMKGQRAERKRDERKMTKKWKKKLSEWKEHERQWKGMKWKRINRKSKKKARKRMKITNFRRFSEIQALEKWSLSYWVPLTIFSHVWLGYWAHSNPAVPRLVCTVGFGPFVL